MGRPRASVGDSGGDRVPRHGDARRRSQRSVDEALHRCGLQGSGRAGLAPQGYLGELRELYESFVVAPDLDFHERGLGRRPLGVDRLPPYLATWVWIPGEPACQPVSARAAEAFRRRTEAPAVARTSFTRIHALVATDSSDWIKPEAPTAIGEIVVFL
jgi:hypothetical protein